MVCSECSRSLSEDSFYKRSRGGVLSICKECRSTRNKSYYQRNKEMLEESKTRRIDVAKDYICSVFETGCADCGTTDIRVLEFDHLGNKITGISQMRGYSLSKIKEEIAKCEVVCANCHNIRTSERRKDWRFTRHLENERIGDRK